MFVYESDCLCEGPRIICGMHSLGVVLRDPSPHLREFWRKPRKTQNGYIHKRDRELISLLPLYPLRAQNRSATGGAFVIRIFLSYNIDFLHLFYFILFFIFQNTHLFRITGGKCNHSSQMITGLHTNK